jgi:hypothetical protein
MQGNDGGYWYDMELAPQPDTTTTTVPVQVQKTIQVPKVFQVTHIRSHVYYYSLENNGSYYYVVLHDIMKEDDVEKSHTTQIVKYYNQQVPYNATIPGTATPIMYGDYVYKSRLETRYRTETRTETYSYKDYEWHPCYYENGSFVGGWFSEVWRTGTTTRTVKVPYQVTVYDPFYIPGIIVPNNFKFVDIAQIYYKNNKLVRGQYNIGAYSSYANIYNNTPYYAIDYSEYRRNTYHNGIRTLWPRTASILFEKSAGQTEPYPQPNVTYIGNLTNNKPHFNSLSEAKYA